ncbi:MAG: M20 family metallopeptidase [Firmicutes bacterium]|nr:M20 family metallopeptidase [Bacillota bacterium]
MSRVVELTSKLVKFNTTNPPGNEGEITRFLADFMHDIGMKVQVWEISSGRLGVIGRLEGGVDRVLVFNGHTDVVPPGDNWASPPFEATVQEKDGKLFGRGTSDMKGAIASMIVAFEKLAKVPKAQRPHLELHLVPDEEDAGKGAVYLVENEMVKADAAVFGEPTNLQVNIAEKGAAWMKARCYGLAAHASVPFNGINSINKAAEVIMKLEKGMPQILKPKTHPLVGEATINIGTITGGTRVNTVPDFCEFTIDRRMIPGEIADNVLEEIRRVVGDLAQIELFHVEEPAETLEQERIVTVARQSVTKIVGKDLGIGGFVGSTDARFYINQVGVPSIILGPGSMKVAHQVNEFVEIAELEKAVEIYFDIALSF